MAGQTISEKILSAHCGRDVRAGEIVVCAVDLVIGTDASTPMAIDYFERMGGTKLFDPERVLLALDHYAPPNTPGTRAFHERIQEFATRYGAELHEAGEGISHQLAAELGRVLPGDLVIGADSHTVTCGALNLFATGVGSSDLAAALITGHIWLRVPETIQVLLRGARPDGVGAKDIALELVGTIGADGANYQAIEFDGPALTELTLEDRMVLSNLAVEMGAKAAIFPCDDATCFYIADRSSRSFTPEQSDPDARYTRTVEIDIAELTPRVALPHAPDRVADLEQAVGTPVQMVFIGTCCGGRISDFRAALGVLERAGSRIAQDVQLVLTPASREVYQALQNDGSLARFEAMGATVTTPGCGACCGTSGIIPGDGMNVLSTANRNFKARMGNATASIWLASAEACAAAAVTGRITDPRAL